MKFLRSTCCQLVAIATTACIALPLSAHAAPSLNSVNTIQGGLEGSTTTITYDEMETAADYSGSFGSPTFKASAVNGTLTENGNNNGELEFGESWEWTAADPDVFGDVNAFQVRASDFTGDSNPAQVQVNLTGVNDPPTFIPGGDIVIDEDDENPPPFVAWATGISAGPYETAQNLTFQVSTSDPPDAINPDGLFLIPPAISPNGTLTFTQNENANGTVNCSVILVDDGGTANGGIDVSLPPIATFTITISQKNDEPEVLGGPFATFDGPTVQVPLFLPTPAAGEIEIEDVDDGTPGLPETETITVTVSIAADDRDLGGFAELETGAGMAFAPTAPDGQPVPNPPAVTIDSQDEVDGFEVSGRPDELTRFMREFVMFLPTQNLVAVGDTSNSNPLSVTVEVEDPSGTSDSELFQIAIISVNDPPVVGISVNEVTAFEGRTVAPFGDFTVSDPDLNEQVMVEISFTGEGAFELPTPAGSGAINADVLTFTGTPTDAQAYVRQVGFRPTGGEVTFEFRVTDIHPANPAGNPPPPDEAPFVTDNTDGSLTMAVIEVNRNPQIGGITTSLQRIDENQTAPLFSTVSVVEPDGDKVKVTVTVPEAWGTLSRISAGANPFVRSTTNPDLYELAIGTAADATSALRDLEFVPDVQVAGSVLGFTLNITDHDDNGDAFGGSASDSRTQVEVREIEESPQLTLPDTSSEPLAIPPGDRVNPFLTADLTDDDQLVTVKVSLLDPSKGSLSNGGIPILAVGADGANLLVTSSVAGLAIGDLVRIEGDGGTGYNTIHAVSDVDEVAGTFTTDIPFSDDAGERGVWTRVFEIAGYADGGPGMPGATIVSATAHGLADGGFVQVFDSGGAAYDGLYPVTVVDADTFSLPVAFSSDPAQRGVFAHAFGPLGTAMQAVTDGDGRLRVTADVTGLEVGDLVRIAGDGVAAYNTTHPVTAVDQDAGSFTLDTPYAGGVGERGLWTRVSQVTGYADGMPDRPGMTDVTSPDHGLVDGAFVQIFDTGDPGSAVPVYDGIYPVTVIDPDTFSVPIQFSGAPAALGVFGKVGASMVFVGTPASANIALRGLRFTPNPSLSPPVSATFEISADDGTTTPASQQLSIILASARRNLLVTKSDDVPVPPAWVLGQTYQAMDQVIVAGNVWQRLVPGAESTFDPGDPNHFNLWRDIADSEGTLRVALALAEANDTITFALPGYPQTIRLDAPLAIGKPLTIEGPGADKLTISGDSDGDGSPDTQILRVDAGVTIEGVTLSHGTATSGGAVGVRGGGSLTMRYCAVRNSVATRWGGGIDVDGGTLTLENCLVEGNSTSATSGLGGAGVSLFTSQPCAFINTTFSGNLQASSSAFGGGALYVENPTPETQLPIRVTHCTFAANQDASNTGTSIQSRVFGTAVRVANSIVADGQGGNLRAVGTGEIDSLGGNLSDDLTRANLNQGGSPQANFHFDHPTDQTQINPRLGSLAVTVGATACHPLAATSPAINASQSGAQANDGRGVIRVDGMPDSGAFEHGGTPRIVVNEIRFGPTADDFIEFYVPRDSVPLLLDGYQLRVDGELRHTFANGTRIQPGLGIIVADSNVATNGTTIVPPSVPPLDLQARGLIELRAPGAGGVAVSVRYNGVFADIDDPSADVTLDPGESITLAPQFMGFAYVRHSIVQPPIPGMDGVDPNRAGDPDSLLKDTGGTPFGGSNAPPIANADSFILSEDQPALLDLLANDLDADGSDRLVIVDVDTDPITGGANDATAMSNQLADLRIEPAGGGSAATPNRGLDVYYDPRPSTMARFAAELRMNEPSLQSLPVGQERVDRFSYTIVDFTTGVVESYQAGGATETVIGSPAHRLQTGAEITISGSGESSYDTSHSVTVIDPDHFSIPVTHVDGVTGGTWETDETRAIPVTTAIASYTDGGGGLTTIIGAPGHGLAVDDTIIILGSGEPGYDRNHRVTAIAANSFTIDADFVAGVAGGLWKRPPGGDDTCRDIATVTVTVLGANDTPTPVGDAVATKENQVLRIMADSDLADLAMAGTGTTFDSDPIYTDLTDPANPIPPVISGESLLIDDTDPDTDDDGESLRVVGVVGSISEISDYTRAPGGDAVTVTCAGHGLADDDTILIAGYGGHPSYNAVHTVSVLDENRFNIPVPFVDNHDPARGVWALYTPGARLSAISEKGAEVTLEIRADHRETNIVYNPRASLCLGEFADNCLDGISLGVSESDQFYYAAQDSHGAIGLARVTVTVEGVNDPPVPGNDPPALSALDPLLDERLDELLDGDEADSDTRREELRKLLAELDVAYMFPSSDGSDTRTKAGLFDPENPDAGAIDIDLLWMTDEESVREIEITDLLANDSDIDRDDSMMIELPAPDHVSREGAAVTMVGSQIIYNPIGELDRLARGEKVVDTFVVNVVDGKGGSVPSLVAVLVVGLNDTPIPDVLALQPPLTFTTPEDQQYLIGGPLPDDQIDPRPNPQGVLADDFEPDQNRSLPDNRKMLVPMEGLRSELAGVPYSTRTGGAEGTITRFDPDPGNPAQTIVTATGQQLESGELVVISDVASGGTGIPEYEGEFEIVAIDEDAGTFTIPVPFVTGSTFAQGNWRATRQVSGSVSNFRPDPSAPGTYGDPQDPGQTIVTALGHRLDAGAEVVLRGSGVPEYEGLFVIEAADRVAGTFTVPVTFRPGTSLAGGEWAAVHSSVIYDAGASISATAPPDHPDLVPNGLDGLSEGEMFTDRISYQIFDGSFMFAMDDMYKVAADTPEVILDVLANDSNLTEITRFLSLVAVSPTSNGGTAELITGENGNEFIRYVPEPNFVGDEAFSYSIEDELGNRDTAQVTVRVTVNSLNGNLQAKDDAFTVALGQEPILDVLANDNILPAGAGTLEIVGFTQQPLLEGTGASRGTAETTAGGGVLFIPDNASDGDLITFKYEVGGGGTARAEATVTIKIVDRTDALFTRDDAFSVLVDSANNPLDVLSNDNILPGNGLALTVDFVRDTAGLPTNLPAQGALELNATRDGFLYTPEPDFVGIVNFSYSASDGFGGTGSAGATIIVGSLVTNNDFFVVPADAADKPLAVLANDLVIDRPGGAISITGISATSDGTPSAPTQADPFELNSPSGKLGDLVLIGGEIQFTADPGAAFEEAKFFYTISDSSSDRTAVGMATVAVVAEGVSANPDFYSVLQDSAATEFDVLLNDIAVPVRPLTLVSIGTGLDAPDQGGSAQVVTTPAGPRVRYQPASGFLGEESFTYTVTDSDSSDTTTVVVNVGRGDLYANPDAFTVFYDEPGDDPDDPARSFTLPVLTNDAVLPDAGETLTITGVGIDETTEEFAPDEEGEVVIAAGGTSLIYTPAKNTALVPGDTFKENFTYVVSDGSDRRAEAQVEICVRVRDNARAMETNNDTFTVATDSQGDILDVLANDGVKPAPADGWTITGVTVPQLLPQGSQPGDTNDPLPSDANHGVHADDGGTAVVSGGAILYAPRAGFVGFVSFTYDVSDGLGGTGSATVVVKVGDVQVCGDRYTVLSDSTGNSFDVLANDGILPDGIPVRPEGSPLPGQGFVLDIATPIQTNNGGTAIVMEADPVGDPLDGTTRKIVYTPQAGFVGTERFSYWVVDDSDNYYHAEVSVNVELRGSDRATGMAEIVVIGVNDLPVIEGTADWTITDKEVIEPFGGVTLTDVDDQGEEELMLTLRLDSARGILWHPAGLFSGSNGVYTSAFMSPAEATAALRGLQFQPTPDGRVSRDISEDIQITLEVDDGHAVVTDDSTTVTAQHPPQSQVLPVITATGIDASMTDAQFGSAVAISGDTMAVGSWGRDVSGIDSGAVFIYQRVSLGGFDSWQQTKLVVPSDGSVGDLFGGSVALDGDTLVVGASLDDPGGHNAAGSAYVFERNAGGPDNWGQVKKIVVESALRNPGDQFGKSVAISANTVLVGAPFSNRAAGDSGMARLYERDQGGPGNWGLHQEIVQDSPVFIDWFGNSVAIDGDTLIVGAYGSNRTQDESGFDLGAAYIFERSEPPEAPWLQTKKLDRFADPRAMRDDNFGWAVGLSGDTAIVSAFRFDPTPETPDAGAAFLYYRDSGGDDNWGEVREMLAAAPLADERLGYSVAIDGPIALVGAHSPATPALPGFVQCYVLDIGTETDWRFTDTLLPPDPTVRSGFGFSVEVDTLAAAVGAPFDRDNPAGRQRAGAVYVAQLQLPDLNAFAQFVRAWQLANFSVAVLQDPAAEADVWGLEANPDFDPYSNALEMLMGTDPNQKDADPNRVRFEPLPDGSYSLVYQRSKDFPIEFVRSRWSTDLHLWRSANVTEAVESDLGAAEVIRATLDIAPQDSLFFRLYIGRQ